MYPQPSLFHHSCSARAQAPPGPVLTLRVVFGRVSGIMDASNDKNPLKDYGTSTGLRRRYGKPSTHSKYALPQRASGSRTARATSGGATTRTRTRSAPPYLLRCLLPVLVVSATAYGDRD
eukprot:3936962-Rhodomonas_salina.1